MTNDDQARAAVPSSVTAAPKSETKAAEASTPPGAKAKRLHSVGSAGDDDGQFRGYVFGLAYSPDGKLWVSNESRVQVFRPEGKDADGVFHEGRFLYHVAKGLFKRAYGIAFDTKGNAYVADYDADCVVVTRLDGSFVRKIGSSGSGHLEFKNPFGVAFSQDNIFVTEFTGNRVQVLGRDGVFVRAFGTHGRAGGQFDRPTDIDVTPTGEVAVVDSGNHRVQVSLGVGLLLLIEWFKVFDFNGKLLRLFGSLGSTPGKFSFPYGLAIDGLRGFVLTVLLTNALLFAGAGNFVIADTSNKRVQVCKPDGTFITAFDAASEPYSIVPDNENRIYVGLHNEVQLFGFLQ